jgi:hypothetical protein
MLLVCTSDNTLQAIENNFMRENLYVFSILLWQILLKYEKRYAVEHNENLDCLQPRQEFLALPVFADRILQSQYIQVAFIP